MYRVLEESHDHIVGIAIDGKLTKEDYDVLIPFLENRINESGPMSLLCDMSQFMGVDMTAFWEDFQFRIEHLRDFRRIAILGDHRWSAWYTKTLNPFLKTELGYFPLTHIHDAWHWVKSKSG